MELTSEHWAHGYALRGPLTVNRHGALDLSTPDGGDHYWIRDESGNPCYGERRTLTVVSRAPRPAYVNHPRPDPVDGDVVRDANDDSSADAWVSGKDAVGTRAWRHTASGRWLLRSELPDRLRLLVDGETGLTVPS